MTNVQFEKNITHNSFVYQSALLRFRTFGSSFNKMKKKTRGKELKENKTNNSCAQITLFFFLVIKSILMTLISSVGGVVSEMGGSRGRV